MTPRRALASVGAVAMALAVLPLSSSAATSAPADRSRPTVSQALKFDVSRPMREVPPQAGGENTGGNIPEHGEAAPADTGHARDAALQPGAGDGMPGPVTSFEGLSNADNPRLVSPPDPVGDVGLHHYVEMVNLTWAVYSKSGQRLYGPATLGSIWDGFLADCERSSGDPIVLYDEIANRWLLSQFSTTGPEYFNCVAVSATQDPLGSYYRYAFSTGLNFPDYPKYGVWPDAYYITTREFAPNDSESIGVYAVDRRQMLTGNPNPRMVGFNYAAPRYLVGDGILPADLDGNRMPPVGSPGYFAGSMDSGYGPDGAQFDALNLFEMKVNWAKPASSTFQHTASVPTADFDSMFPCSPTSRNCIAQPDTNNKVDVLSYRQRPTWRLAYRNFGTHESLVTNQSVEARKGQAGVRWWELRNPSNPMIHQEGTYAPDDGVHRWMGSAAMDSAGNLAVGYSVSNGTDVYPGIRYAGRLAGDPAGELGQGEAVLINGSGSQTGSPRWGDYTSLNVDPKDDCTFWYVNEYYETTSIRGWQTRIGAFRFPGCG
ncbi:MAG: hypothetical protein ACRDTM_05660 [Micromonosporaceae bacterium]